MAKWWEESLLKHQKSVANVLVNQYRYKKWDVAYRKAGWILQELEKASKSFSNSPTISPNSQITERLQAMGSRALREINKSVKDKVTFAFFSPESACLGEVLDVFQRD